MPANPLRQLPSVDALLGQAHAAVARHGRDATVEAVRAALSEARAAGEARSPEALLARVEELLDRPPSLRPVLNATGVIVHTNLGRAPLAPSALERIAAVAGGYSNLEYDLGAGAADPATATAAPSWPSSPAPRTPRRNNNAAAVLLSLAALAAGREVVIAAAS